VPARLFGWHAGQAQAVMPAAAAPQAPEDEPTPLSFPEAAVLDWTIRHADGREEGDFARRYLEAATRTRVVDLR